ncbi:MAG TPA: hypothetical protein VFU31_24720 [Candidatus Binatia bacterium]|nr:hypothetical protein [Candidatus Binatia bacterium]
MSSGDKHWDVKMHEWNKPEREMDHMNQEPLDFAAALALLRKAREEIKRLRVRPERTYMLLADKIKLAERIAAGMNPEATHKQVAMYAIDIIESLRPEAKMHLEIERQIGALQNEGLTGLPLALLHRCSRIIKGFEERVRPEATSIPEGWKLVPKEPTEDMLDNARTQMFVDLKRADGLRIARKGYYAMVYAAPEYLPQAQRLPQEKP